MQALEREVLHRLLTHAFPEDYESYFDFFESEEREALSKLRPMESELKLKLQSPLEVFHKIHYSWFMAPLEQLSKPLIEQALSLFSPEQKKKIAKFKGFKKSKSVAFDHLKDFLVVYLLQEIGIDQICPISFLPDSAHLGLLNLSKEQLVLLIEHLGLCEIAQASKKIVDPKVLSKMMKALKTSQRKPFIEAREMNEPKSPSLHDFHSALKDLKTFQVYIEKKGIERLARGLVFEHPSFIWYLAHHLDRGRGQELLKNARRFLPNPYTSFYQKQLIEYRQKLEEKLIT